MAKLTRKQEKFVEAYIETGNGTKSALEAYDTVNPLTAAVIASENLIKPNIITALTQAIEDEELLGEKFKAMLNTVRLDYFVFPKSMTDEEIEEHVDSVGLECVNVRPSDKGKLAFFAIPDAHAIGKALDMAFKLKGRYAGEKHLHAHVHIEASPKIKDLAKKLNQ